ncbi:MAG: flagellar biosynthesis protein FlhB [Candidatus Lindowbacteria bacterium]|nr:flagellar biosynthesis protein FlhB [Candidatus Lindowbacteria bacterium]
MMPLFFPRALRFSERYLFSKKKQNQEIPYFKDLQMFAAEDEGRTEDPTDKRIEKAREEGQVPRSVEINQVIALFLGFLVIMVMLPKFIGYEMVEVTYFLGNLSTLEFSHAATAGLAFKVTTHMFLLTWPIMATQLFVAIFGNVAQVGFMFSWQTIQPKFNKFWPSFSKVIDKLLIGKTMIFNLAKSLLKLIGVIWIAYYVMSDSIPKLLSTWQMGTFNILDLIVKIAYELTWKICLWLIVLAAGDYVYNRYQWKQSIMMKKEEVKDERKQADGDPEVKRAQRKRMMEASRKRMMRELPSADVVITNPTHYAVAIRYDQSKEGSPRVLAKGEGYTAIKIKERASELGIPMYENVKLARELYALVEVGEEIPQDLFGAVAEVLVWLYKQHPDRSSAAA